MENRPIRRQNRPNPPSQPPAINADVGVNNSKPYELVSFPELTVYGG